MTRRGATAVEFAFVMLPLIYLVFGIIQYGLYFYARETGTQAAGDAVRRLSVGDCQTPSELRTLVANRLGNATATSANNLTLTPVYKKADGTADVAPGTPGGSVQLTVTFSCDQHELPVHPAAQQRHHRIDRVQPRRGRHRARRVDAREPPQP